MYDVIVVGGGIVGMSTAYHLVCAGARALLIDREDRGRATDAGAGILSPETNSRDPDAWFDFAVAAVGYYPTLPVLSLDAPLSADGDLTLLDLLAEQVEEADDFNGTYDAYLDSWSM